MKMSSFFRPTWIVLSLCATALMFTSCDDDDDNDPDESSAVVFMSSNTTGQVGVVDADEPALSVKTFSAAGADADGIFYDGDSDMLYQVDRSNSRLVAYEDVETDDGLLDLLDIELSMSSSSNFENGRGLAVKDDMYIVAQDATDTAPNRFAVYQRSGSSFTFAMSISTDINLWGIQMVGDDLYAIVDNSDQLAIFNDFLQNMDGQMVMADQIITIDGIVRTHGLEYDEKDDVLVLTDVGDAASGTDGALLFLNNWSSLKSKTTITSTDYSRIAGDDTMLGNPVDVDYDAETNMAYVAERKRDGGLLLVFGATQTGNAMPMKMAAFEGASSIYFHRD